MDSEWMVNGNCNWYDKFSVAEPQWSACAWRHDERQQFSSQAMTENHNYSKQTYQYHHKALQGITFDSNVISGKLIRMYTSYHQSRVQTDYLQLQYIAVTNSANESRTPSTSGNWPLNFNELVAGSPWRRSRGYGGWGVSWCEVGKEEGGALGRWRSDLGRGKILWMYKYILIPLVPRVELRGDNRRENLLSTSWIVLVDCLLLRFQSRKRTERRCRWLTLEGLVEYLVCLYRINVSELFVVLLTTSDHWMLYWMTPVGKFVLRKDW